MMQMLWKKETLAPSDCAFNVTTPAPHHTMTNTAVKTREACPSGAVILSTTERNRQMKSGPHKSPVYRECERAGGEKGSLVYKRETGIAEIYSRENFQVVYLP